MQRAVAHLEAAIDSCDRSGSAVLEDPLTGDRAWVQDLGGVLPQVLAWLGGEVHDSDQEVET